MAAPVTTKPGWRFGVFEVDARKGELRRSGVPVKLREQSLQILLALLEDPGEIVSREELRRRLWTSDTFVEFDHSLNTAMMKLRDALGDSAESPMYIETVPKRGYRFIAPATPKAEKATEEGASHEADPWPASHEDNEPATQDGLTGAGDLAVAVKQSVAVPDAASGIWLVVAVAGVLLLLVTALVTFLRARHALFSEPAREALAGYRIDAVTTFRGSVKDPAITADGRDVAYVWNGDQGEHFDVYVQRIGATLPMRLTYGKTGFVGGPAWSPDQREIAFTRCDGVNDGVYIVPALGGPERKLTSTSCQYHAPTPVAWLSGSRLLMIDRCAESGVHGLALLSMDTGEKHCIADLGESQWNRRFRYSVSPDQRRVAFLTTVESPLCEIYTVAIDGGLPRRVFQDNAACDDLMWTPDGKEIVFLSERTKFPSFWQIPASGGSVRHSIYPSIGTFSKDGRRFVYSEQANGEPIGIWRADLAGPGGKVLSNRKVINRQIEEADAQPSPDGARMVWVEIRGGIGNVWTSSSSGENPLQLTSMNSYSGTPRWSPQGDWIAFDSYMADGPQIFVVDAQGRNLHAITKGPTMNVVPSWSRDGRFIYFSSIRSGRREIWKHSLATGQETQLTTQGGMNACESFDGKTVYFAKFDGAGIWSIPSSGGSETVVLEGRPPLLFWGHWALTRQGIYLLNPDAEPKARVEFYDFASRRTFPVFALEKNAVIAGPSLSATDDGKTIFYTQWDQQSAIKMMEFQQ